MAKINEIKKEFTLNQIFRYPEGVMTRKQWLKMMLLQGWQAVEKNVRNYAAEEKLAHTVAWQRRNVPLGNPNYPDTKRYFENKAKLEAGIYKTVYSLEKDRSSYDITKTEFEYFRMLELEIDKKTEKNELEYKIQAGTATDKEIDEAMLKEFEFAAKYF